MTLHIAIRSMSATNTSASPWTGIIATIVLNNCGSSSVILTHVIRGSDGSYDRTPNTPAESTPCIDVVSCGYQHCTCTNSVSTTGEYQMQTLSRSAQLSAVIAGKWECRGAVHPSERSTDEVAVQILRLGVESDVAHSCIRVDEFHER